MRLEITGFGPSLLAQARASGRCGALAMLAVTLSSCLQAVTDVPLDAGSCDGAHAADAGSSSAADAGTAAPPPVASLGWSIRDAAPYARVGHAAVYDSLHDRMIVFGGGGNDTWELPFTGPSAGVWRYLNVRGNPPLASVSLTWVSAVADPAGQRMIVLVSPASASSAPASPALWQLSLDDVPTWSPLPTTGVSPGPELSRGRLAIDPKHRTLYAVGGWSLTPQLGLWSLSLDGAAAWTRVADFPAQAGSFSFVSQTELLFDPAREQLILFAAPFDLWAFSPTLSTWSLLDPVNPYSNGDSNGYGRSGVTVMLDGARDRIVMLGGDLIGGIDTFSLSNQTWSTDTATDGNRRYQMSVVIDPQRDRAVYFGGRIDGAADVITNATWSLSLDSMTFDQLMPETLSWDGCQRDVVYDPVRRAAIAFSNNSTCGPNVLPSLHYTLRHTLTDGDLWQTMNAGDAPVSSFAAAVYVDAADALFTIGGDVAGGATLASTAAASWELTSASDGPSLGQGHTVVYDAAGKRALLFGGSSYVASPGGGGAVTFLDGVWSLDFSGAPVWSQLTTEGSSPPKRSGHAAIYDARQNRMLVLGGRAEDNSALDDLWELTLGTSPPVWNRLTEAGVAPPLATDLDDTDSHLQALYDDSAHRLIVVSGSDAGLAVHALDLDGSKWHHFCSSGFAPVRLDTSIVIVGDALFASEGSGAVLFNLSSPYCD